MLGETCCILVQLQSKGCYCGNGAVVRDHRQQLKGVGGFREVTQFSLGAAAGAVLSLKRFCIGNQRQLRYVSSEQFFVSMFWSFSVSLKVNVEQTLRCSGQIYGKACYYTGFFCSKHLRRKGSIFFPCRWVHQGSAKHRH